jgi:hypothetical protein
VYLISPKKRLQRCFIRIFGGYKAATKYHGVAAEELVKRFTILSGETITGVYDTAKGGLVEKFGLSEAGMHVIRVAEALSQSVIFTFPVFEPQFRIFFKKHV